MILSTHTSQESIGRGAIAAVRGVCCTGHGKPSGGMSPTTMAIGLTI